MSAAKLEPAAAGTTLALDPIEEAIRAMAAGRPVLVVDNEDRENEGDIIFAAQYATPALMGWTVRYSSGVICVPLDEDRATALALPPMVEINQAPPTPSPAMRRSASAPGSPQRTGH